MIPLFNLKVHRYPTLCRHFHRQTGELHTRSKGGGGGGYRRSGRCPPRRSSNNFNPNSPVLLEKFVKHLNYNGSLVVKSPFNVKVRGSYFDKNNNVDRSKNKRVYDEIYNSTETPSPSSEDDTNKVVVEPRSEEVANVERNILNKLSETLDSLASSKRVEPRKSPLHVLLFGRLHHRVDSYSIVDSNDEKHKTHVYITDANSFDEAQSMLVQHLETLDGDQNSVVPDAHVSFWQPSNVVVVYPKDLKNKKLKTLLTSTSSTFTNGDSDDHLVSTMKLFCPKHLLEIPNPGLKTVFLVPTLMNRIYIQGERSSHLELDSSLIHKLHAVGLTTDFGNIRVRDLIADEIRLASTMGDIMCEGSLDGHSVIEVNNDGDFLASYIDGPSLLVTTDDGDINVWGDVNSDVSQFYTRNGHINVKYIYNQCYMLVKNAGNITVNVVEGFITAIVKKGSILASFDKLTADSNLQVEEGDITLSIPLHRNFRIQTTSPKTNIMPQILNQGELFVNDSSSFTVHTFQSESKTTTPQPAPILKVEAINGTVNIMAVSDERAQTSSETENCES